MRALRLLVAGWAAVILGVPLLVFACGDDIPQGVIYAFDTPRGGVPVNPNIVTCGHTECHGECCAGPGLPSGGQCFPDASPPCPPGGGAITCNESADCNVHQSCCATPPSSGGYLTAACASTCAPAQMQLCRTNGECPGNSCVIQRCPDGVVYEVCGLSTSPSFACTKVAVLPDGALDLDGGLEDDGGQGG